MSTPEDPVDIQLLRFEVLRALKVSVGREFEHIRGSQIEIFHGEHKIRNGDVIPEGAKLNILITEDPGKAIAKKITKGEIKLEKLPDGRWHFVPAIELPESPS
jgi:hypothetical protein